MHEQKYRYFIDGKEVDNRTDYLNATMSGDYVTTFDDNVVFSVSFNSFFGEYEERVPNKDNNKMIKREVNGHIHDIIGGYTGTKLDPNHTPMDILDLGQIKQKERIESLITNAKNCKNGNLCFCDGSCKKPQENSLHNSTRHKAREEGKFHVVGYLEGINEPKYKETTLEELKENTINNVELGLTMVEILGVTLCDNKEYIYNMLARKIAEKENREQSSKTEENLVFPKDSEIHKEGKKVIKFNKLGEAEFGTLFLYSDTVHFDSDALDNDIKEYANEHGFQEWFNLGCFYDDEKEELPPHQPLDFSLLLTDWTNRLLATKGTPTTFTVDELPLGSFGKRGQKIDYSVGIKESQTTEKAPIFTYCKINKNALEALALRALYGHNKYNINGVDEDWQNFKRVPNGEEEYANAQFRHALEIGGEEDEKEHLVSSAWNAISRLQIYLEKNL